MPKTNGKNIRKWITSFYEDKLKGKKLNGFPFLDSLYVYNECRVQVGIDIDSNDNINYGYFTECGQFIRHNSEQTPYRKGDSTISSFLAGLHYSISEEFNRFYSYTHETRKRNKIPYKYDGFSKLNIINDKNSKKFLSKYVND